MAGVEVTHEPLLTPFHLTDPSKALSAQSTSHPQHISIRAPGTSQAVPPAVRLAASGRTTGPHVQSRTYSRGSFVSVPPYWWSWQDGLTGPLPTHDHLRQPLEATVELAAISPTTLVPFSGFAKPSITAHCTRH